MSLQNALLGVLSIRPMSGYDVKKFFDRIVGMIWNANHAQIYRVLSRMEGDGLVKQESIPQNGKPTKKVYSLTSQGQAELRRWLEQPVVVPDMKDEFMLWFFFSDRMDRTKARERLVEARGLNQGRLETLETVLDGKLPAASRTILQAAKLGARYYGECVSWIDETIDLIDRGEL